MDNFEDMMESEGMKKCFATDSKKEELYIKA